MEKRELTCIVCPSGCPLIITLQDGAVLQVEGNQCKRGAEYGAAECVAPVRMLTTTVRVRQGALPLSVKSASPLPKPKLAECLQLLADVEVVPPIRVGDVIAADIAGTGIDMIATKNILAES